MESKLKNKVRIIGEGITEKHFLQSLRDDFPYVKCGEYVELEHANNLAELERRIEEAAQMGFPKVFCMIDMDNKKEGMERDKYLKLKRKYAKPIINKRKGIYCEVRFYETERCTEQFFLYYFSSTTRKFQSYEELEKELHRYCEYEKRERFFAKHPLHLYFTDKGGNIITAKKNAEMSMSAVESGERNYSYSELGRMLKDLKEFEANKSL